MQYLRLFILICSISFVDSSCTRHYDLGPIPVASSITVVNAAINAPAVVVDFSNSPVQWIASAETISFGSSFEYSIPSGQTPVSVIETPDSTQDLFDGTVEFTPQGIYSLFLSGILNGQNQADTLLTIDNPPYFSINDSMMGFRFVNLSPGSNPISVDIQGSANGSTVASLGYKGITGFMPFPATSAYTQYSFEIRDAATGKLLTTASPNVETFQSMTIAVIGQEDSTAATPIQAIEINNF